MMHLLIGGFWMYCRLGYGTGTAFWLQDCQSMVTAAIKAGFTHLDGMPLPMFHDRSALSSVVPISSDVILMIVPLFFLPSPIGFRCPDVR